MTEIIIPDSVTSLGNSAFNGCANLKSATINGVACIDKFMFYWCFNLESVIIGNGVTSIDEHAFVEFEKLKSVTIGNQVANIGRAAFANCTALTEIIIPESVETIDAYAFAYCENLTIYCEVESKPDGWNDDWNSENCPIVWGI